MAGAVASASVYIGLSPLTVTFSSSDTSGYYQMMIHSSNGNPAFVGSYWLLNGEIVHRNQAGFTHTFDEPGQYTLSAHFGWKGGGQIISHGSEQLVITVLESGGIVVPAAGDPHAEILKLRQPSVLPFSGVMAFA